MGFLYAAPHRRDGTPLEQGWMNRAGAEDFARLVDYRDAYRPGARRYDMGEVANFGLLPMTVAALEQLLAWGVADIQATLAARTASIAARAATLGLTSTPAPLRAGHFLGLGFPDGLPPGLPDRLAAENVHVSVRGASLRVTPHLWNDDEDVDRLFAALEATL
jgi:selenocysteine lyase/cysteine desulfurase